MHRGAVSGLARTSRWRAVHPASGGTVTSCLQGTVSTSCPLRTLTTWAPPQTSIRSVHSARARNPHVMGAPKKLQIQSYRKTPSRGDDRTCSSRPESDGVGSPDAARYGGSTTAVLLPARREKAPHRGSQVVTFLHTATAELANGPCRFFEVMATRRRACPAHRHRVRIMEPFSARHEHE